MVSLVSYTGENELNQSSGVIIATDDTNTMEEGLKNITRLMDTHNLAEFMKMGITQNGMRITQFTSWAFIQSTGCSSLAHSGSPILCRVILFIFIFFLRLLQIPSCQSYQILDHLVLIRWLLLLILSPLQQILIFPFRLLHFLKLLQFWLLFMRYA